MAMARPNFDEESYLWKKGYEHVVGIDEVGRGAFAGPLVAAGVIFSPNIFEYANTTPVRYLFETINDSKLLSPQKRQKLAEVIKHHALCTAVAEVSTSVINKLGIGKANFMAFRQVVRRVLNILNPQRSRLFVLVDGFHVSYLRNVGETKQKAIIKGDQKSISISAASIIAKVYRDRLMSSLPKKYAVYRFSTHKGYGTAFHQQMIKEHGLCNLHRTSFNLSKFTA